MKIIMVDQDSSFDGNSYRSEPLGGTESAFVCLAEALSKLGHLVIAATKIKHAIKIEGVSWLPITSKFDECDIYICNRAPELLSKAPINSKKVLWLHNPGNYLKKLKNIKKLLFNDLVLVCSGDYHFQTIPFWLKNRTVKVPLGLSDEIFKFSRDYKDIPEPISVFSSNPERGLIWLSQLWKEKISIKIPSSKLLLFAGYETYGGRKKSLIKNILQNVKNLNSSNIEINKPIKKKELFKKIFFSRIMLYRGDVGETFCLSVAEAQGLGVPAVVKSVGSLPERVVHNVTGFVVNNDDEFVRSAITILTDDELWKKMSNNCMKIQRENSWDKVAKEFIAAVI